MKKYEDYMLEEKNIKSNRFWFVLKSMETAMLSAYWMGIKSYGDLFDTTSLFSEKNLLIDKYEGMILECKVSHLNI